MSGPRTGPWLRRAGHLRWWRCTGPPARAGEQVPARYRLSVADVPPTLEEFLLALEQESGVDARPAAGVVWTRQEFLDQQWVDEWIGEGGEGERFRDAVFAAYGEKIPADLAILDALTYDFQGIETIGREASWVQAAHVLAFAGVNDLQIALHLLYRSGWIIPLTDSTVIAPRLMLVSDG